MKYEQALEQLYSVGKLRKEWDLEIIRKLLAGLGNPEKTIRIINVTGTNGKGSVTKMIASILKESSVGLKGHGNKVSHSRAMIIHNLLCMSITMLKIFPL